MAEAEDFIAAATRLAGWRAGLSPLHGALLLMLADTPGDSSSFARALGLAHALVLRSLLDLEDDFGLIETTGVNERTQRRHVRLTAAGQALISASGSARRAGSAG